MHPVPTAISVLFCISLSAQTRQYSNIQYGYSTRTPSNLTLITNTAPQPNHGFELKIDKNQTITVYASYNTTEEPTAEEALQEWVQENYHHTLKPFSSGNISFSGLQGYRVIGTIKTEGGEKIIDYIKIERRVKSKSTDIQIQYYLFLISTMESYPQSSLIFSSVISTFRTHPIR